MIFVLAKEENHDRGRPTSPFGIFIIPFLHGLNIPRNDIVRKRLGSFGKLPLISIGPKFHCTWRASHWRHAREVENPRRDHIELNLLLCTIQGVCTEEQMRSELNAHGQFILNLSLIWYGSWWLWYGNDAETGNRTCQISGSPFLVFKGSRLTRWSRASRRGRGAWWFLRCSSRKISDLAQLRIKWKSWAITSWGVWQF